MTLCLHQCCYQTCPELGTDLWLETVILSQAANHSRRANEQLG
jgi:hypothetical protein